MIIIASRGNNYLVKTNSNDINCYSVDIELGIVFGYDKPEKFLRFGYYEDYKEDKEVENKILKLLEDKI